jgi:hypothetical protein
MTLTHPPQETSKKLRGPPVPVIALIVLLGLLVIGAFQGGLAMVTNPIDPLGMSPSFLEDTPVDDYFWPGMFLLGIGAASAITLSGLLIKWRWKWAAGIEGFVGYRWPWIAAIAIGAVLLTFEIIELFLIPFHPVMHPLLIAGSLAILVLTLTAPVRRYLET